MEELKKKKNEALRAKEEAQAALNREEENLRTVGESLSKAETNKKVADFALTRSKNSKAWLIILLTGVGFCLATVIISLYWLKSPEVHSFIDGFNYNGSPRFMLIIGLVLVAVGIVFLFIKLNGRKKLIEKAKEADGEFAAAKTIYSEAEQKKKDAEKALEDAGKAFERAEKEYLDNDPEEKKKREDAAKAAEEEALAELRRIEEINQKAAENAQKKAADRVEADKMFEHPQAYVLDGKYENEVEVFKAAAEMGSPEAQERVVSYMLGIIYKNGFKPDVKAGEEKALAFASENTAMYEILGKGFLYGEGDMPKDEEKGLRYLEKAATKGRQNAMLMAGVCHYNGVGTEKDEEKALTFFKKAAKQGNEQAINVVLAMEAGQKLRF